MEREQPFFCLFISYHRKYLTYGGDPSLVGSNIYVQGQPVTVVGIAPPGFFGDRIRTSPPALWIPLAVEPLIERGTRSCK